MKIVVIGQSGKILIEGEFDQFPLIIGRAAPAKLIIPEGDISRQHLEINWDGRILSLTDLKSRNGIFVAGKRIETGVFSLPCTVHIGTGIRMELTRNHGETVGEAVVEPSPKALPLPIRGKAAKKVPESAVASARHAKFLWEWACGIRNHWIFAAALVFGCVYGIFRFAVIRDDINSAVLTAIGAPLGLLLAGMLSAATLALPGWLIRGSYDLKPMVVGFSLAGMAYLFAGDLTVFVFAPLVGHIVKLLIIAAIVFASFSSWISFLMTTFPSHWRGALLRVAVILGVVSTFGASKALVFISRQELLNKLFSLQSGDVVRSIGGPVVAPVDLVNDLRRFTSEKN